MIRLPLFLLIVLTLALQGCLQVEGLPPAPSSTFPGPTPTDASSAAEIAEARWEALVERWLDKGPCAAPCWEGIVPGTTTVAEATRLLSSPPVSAATRVLEFGRSSSLQWETEAYRGEAPFESTDTEPVVTVLNILFVKPLSPAEVVEVYGEPTHVYVQASPSDHPEARQPYLYDLDYVYLDNGLRIDSLVEPLYQIFLFPPSREGLALSLWGFSEPEMLDPGLVPWDGPKAFHLYCRDAFPLEFEARCPPGR